MAMNITVDTLLDRVKDIAPILRAHAAEAEAQRRLARPVIDAMLQVAEAEATLGAGRAYLYATFQENWDVALQGAALTLERKLKMQLATFHAIVCATTAVDLAHAAAGTSSIRNEFKFQQYFRDVHTITQHAFVSASRYESTGALMLGEESDWGFFAF